MTILKSLADSSEFISQNYSQGELETDWVSHLGTLEVKDSIEVLGTSTNTSLVTSTKVVEGDAVLLQEGIDTTVLSGSLGAVSVNGFNLDLASYEDKEFRVGFETSPMKTWFNTDGTKMYLVGTGADTVFQYTLSTPWDVSTASYDSKSFVNSQETDPTCLFFKSDGTKMYIVGYTNKTVYQYTLSTPWDVSTASYDSKSFDVSGQEIEPSDLFFKSDGTKMYIVGPINDTVFQYTLSTPWDVSTASYDSKSFLVSGQESAPRGLFFKSDGTKMYIVGTANDTVYQYTLSTPWDVSTASYDSKSFLVSGQETNPSSLFFKSDGTKMYIVGTTNDTVFQYTLYEAEADITSFSLTSAPTKASFDRTVTLKTSFEETSDRCVCKDIPLTVDSATTTEVVGSITSEDDLWPLVNRNMLEIGDSIKLLVDGVNLTTAITSLSEDGFTKVDIDSLSYDDTFFSVISQDTAPMGIFFKSDGSKMYMIGTSSDSVYQYTLSTPWDLSTASYDSVSFSVTSQDTNPRGIFFKSDGSKMYMVGEISDSVYQYTLSTPWDLSTASYDSVFLDVSGQDTVQQGIFFKSDGSKMYMTGSNSDSVHQYTLSTPWDLSTASYDSVSLDVSGQNSGPSEIFFKSDGSKMYMIGYSLGSVYQYTLSTPWDLSTASYDSVSFSVTGQDTAPYGIFFKDDGSKMYMTGAVSRSVYQYTLTTSWDLSTAYSISLNVSDQESAPTDIFFKSDGSKMYMIGYGSDSVHQYTLSTPWDLLTASYDSVSFNISGQETSPYGIFFKDDGSKMYMTGYGSDSVHQYTLSTPWDLSTASYDSVSLDVSGQDTVPRGIFFKPDGSKMYMIGSNSDSVHQYTLSTPWNLSTASYDSVSFSINSQDTSPQGIFFKSDGSKMYMVGDSSDSVYQYTLSTPWDLSTASYDSVSISVIGQDTNPTGIFFKSDGSKMYMIGSNSDSVHQYSLPTGQSLFNESIQFTVGFAAQSLAPTGITIPDRSDVNTLSSREWVSDGKISQVYNKISKANCRGLQYNLQADAGLEVSKVKFDLERELS